MATPLNPKTQEVLELIRTSPSALSIEDIQANKGLSWGSAYACVMQLIALRLVESPPSEDGRKRYVINEEAG